MGPKDGNWLTDAMDAYRNGRAQLSKAKSLDSEEAQVLTDDITEALLDLKQAVVDLDSARAWQAREELRLLLSDLDDLMQGGAK